MSKTNLKLYDNSWYKPGNFSRRLSWYFINRIFFQSSFPFPSNLKRFLLKIYGANIGEGVVIKPLVNIKYPWFLEIGSFVWIGENVWIDNLAIITIKDNVCISQGAMLLCGNHNYKKSTFDLIVKPITLNEGSWIGAKSIVCPGITIGSHSVLSVGSVATNNLDSNYIYKGNPAVKTKKRIIE